jgi:hypothetical protein
MLVDHLVPGSKETRIAEAVMGEWPDDVIVLGHPYVDVWAGDRIPDGPGARSSRRWMTTPISSRVSSVGSRS